LYEYDILGQLTSVQLPSGREIAYEYDRDGNRTTVSDDGMLTTWQANQMDQYTSIGSQVPQYDGNGNMIAMGAVTYEYDIEGRLTRTSDSGSTVEYEYDALGNRLAMISDGIRTDLLTDPAGFSWVFGEYQANGGNAVYARGNGIAARIDEAGASYYHFDLVGNTRLLTDESAAVSDAYDYLPFGEVTVRAGSTDNPFTFNGQFGITESGLAETYYMRNRNYSAALGRFLELDPIRHQSGETNHYRFSTNDPITTADPSGLTPVQFGGPAVAATRYALGVYNPSFTAFATTSIPGTNLPAIYNPPTLSAPPGTNLPAIYEGTVGVTESTVVAEGIVAEATGGSAGFVASMSNALNGSAAASYVNGATGVRAAGLYGLSAVVGWGIGTVGDRTTDYLFPEAKNDFRNTLANSSLQPGPRPSSPIYENGGIQDEAYNEFQKKNMEDPLIKGVAKKLIASGAYTPEEALLRARQLVNNCRRAGDCDPPKRKRSDIVRARDPNNIVGPAGAQADIPGDPDIQRTRFDGYVLPQGVYQYQIYYENKPSATAPAQIVEVTQTLDVALDLSTFQLTSFGFGDIVVDVPEGRANYFERVDASETLGVLVDFEAALNPDTRELTVTLTSLDPLTLDYPLDPFAGFLPPNVTAPEGDGFIRYSIEPHADLADGVSIDAVARIIFDTEDPIDTPDVNNIIDIAAPASSVSRLPVATGATNITVRWAGDDGTGSGVSHYDVFVSMDDGPYELWLDDTMDTASVFSAEAGHTYAFYSIATDHVGNREAVPAQFDARTIVTSLTWQNPVNQFDVNANGYATPEDILILITYLNANSPDPALPIAPAVPVPFLDVDGDGWCTPSDALLVLTHLNQQARSQGEGELSQPPADSVNSPPPRMEYALSEASTVSLPDRAVIFGGGSAPTTGRYVVSAADDSSVEVPVHQSRSLPIEQEEVQFTDDWDLQRLDEVLDVIAHDIDSQWSEL
jgi:RHS repeat-associated protein